MNIPVVLLTLALTAGAAAPDFNRQEPISLDLKDADVTDVITMLGALANTPVSIAPDVSGKVNISVSDVPYEKVLAMVGAQNALSIRFEGGKLVATRAGRSSAVAPKLERAIEAPRIPVERFAKATETSKPAYFQVQANGSQSCRRILFDGGMTYEVPVPGSTDPVLVTQFGWDGIRRTRVLAIEIPGAEPAAFAVDESASLSIRSDGDVRWSLTTRAPEGGCSDEAPRPHRGVRGDVVLQMHVEEARGAFGEPLMAPRVQVAAGSSFTAREGLTGASGRHDEIALFGFVSSDAKSLAVALMGTAIRTDPRDGHEYVYSELTPSQSIRFTPLTREDRLLGTLPAGDVWSRPLRLSGFVLPNH